MFMLFSFETHHSTNYKLNFYSKKRLLKYAPFIHFLKEASLHKIQILLMVQVDFWRDYLKNFCLIQLLQVEHIVKINRKTSLNRPNENSRNAIALRTTKVKRFV